MADNTQRPDDLVSVSPSGYINTETIVGQQEQSNRPTDLVGVDPDYVAKQVNPYNPVTGVAAGVGAARPLIEKISGSDASARRSMEQYLRSQVNHDYPGLDLAALKKEMQGMYGPKARIATYSEVQDALKSVKGQAGQPAIDLSAYETVAKPTTMAGRGNQLLKKTGEVIEDVSIPGGGFARQSFRAAGRGGLGFGAGYEGAEAYNKAVEGDLGAAIPHASSALGYGALLATNPKIKGAGAVLAGLPLVGKYFAGDAQAAPMSKEDVTGTGFDLATSLLGPASLALAPSQLGDSTLRQNRSNERYHPGMSVLQGSRLAPEKLAEGGSPDTKTMAAEIIQHHLDSKKPKHKKLTIHDLPPGLSKEQFAHLCNGGHVEMSEGGAPKKSRASIAGTLNEVGTRPGPNLASMAREHIASLPKKTAENIANTNYMVQNAMPYNRETGKFDTGPTYSEFANFVPNLMGSTSRVNLPELMELIKRQGGTAAAKRLEQAADLVPNLEQQYQAKALRDAFTGDNASAVMVMKPSDFEKYAAPISVEHKMSPTKGYGIGNAENFENYDLMPKGTYQDYINYLSQYSAPGGGGFSSVPFLQLSQKPNRIFPNIEGHEGRHRTAALAGQGDESTLVKMMPTYNLRESLPRRSQQEYLDALVEKIGSEPMVMPEKYFDNLKQEDVSRGLIKLPKLFKDGGKT